jgi:hypothetical protein
MMSGAEGIGGLSGLAIAMQATSVNAIKGAGGISGAEGAGSMSGAEGGGNSTYISSAGQPPAPSQEAYTRFGQPIP